VGRIAMECDSESSLFIEVEAGPPSLALTEYRFCHEQGRPGCEDRRHELGLVHLGSTPTELPSFGLAHHRLLPCP
jgi:hypothetical protein